MYTTFIYGVPDASPPVEVFNIVLQLQRERCAVTGNFITEKNLGVLIPKHHNLPLDIHNLAVIELDLVVGRTCYDVLRDVQDAYLERCYRH